MRLLHPEMAPWLLAVPAIAFVWLLHFLYKRRALRREAVQPRFAPLSRRTTWRRDAAVLLVSSVSVALLASALMRPQVLRELRVAEFARHDLVIILDRSVSMRARDVAPSRAVRAVAELRNFLRKKPETIDRVGLVGFSASPLILSYLTRDVDSLLFYLDWVAEDPSVFYGTDIGAAITSALEVVAADTRPTPKLFLVISDGEDQGNTLPRALAAAKQQDIPVHTIGIGSSEQTLIPLSRAGERETFLRDDDGRVVTTRFNEVSLRAIAAATNGRYLRSETGTELLAAFDTIVQANLRQTGWQATREYRDIYGLLLAGALAGVAILVAIV